MLSRARARAAGTERSQARLYRTPGGRWLARLDPGDEARYGAAVFAMAPRIELSLGPEVIANRLRPAESAGAGRLRMESWRTARRRFLREARERVGGAGALLVADVRRCYASITTGAVRDQLLRIGCPEADVRRLLKLLRRFQADGIPGLPVGPDPSAVLANAVLAPADRALAAMGAPHVRWVDDFLVFCRDAQHAERAQAGLAGVLERTGLELAPNKTRIIRPPEGSAVVSVSAVSHLAPDYHRRSDADALSGLAGADAVVPPGGGVAAPGPAPRAARGNG